MCLCMCICMCVCVFRRNFYAGVCLILIQLYFLSLFAGKNAFTINFSFLFLGYKLISNLLARVF